ncbi:MAG: Flp pilus assembly complex ATPase component TadA, partial [Bifidobacteriaceae bacterium]|nr:Flp pilus assembly complex ATPase component TadA [Bifidobacteriaceae bacterium]
MFDRAALLRQVLDQVRWDASARDLPDAELLSLITAMVRAGAGPAASVAAQAEVVDAAFNQLRGLGPLDALLADPEVDEVVVNGPDNVFARRGGALQRQAAAFESEARLRDAVARLVRQRVDAANPIMEARLADGTQVSVVAAPVSLRGTALTIRKRRGAAWTMAGLVEAGALPAAAAAALEGLVRARSNIFVCGLGAVGKTALLEACCGLVPLGERAVAVEASAELRLGGLPNWVVLEAQVAGGPAGAAVTVRDLVRAALRTRPDRIALGDVCGGEALDLLAAVGTGPSGALCAAYAASAGDLLDRLEALAGLGAPALPP